MFAFSSPRRRRGSHFLHGVLVLAGLAIGSTASALTVNFTSDGSVSAAAMSALGRAAAQWESRLADPITVTVDVSFGTFTDPKIIGQAASTVLATTHDGYGTVRDALVADAANEPGDGIVSSLPTAAQLSASFPSGISWNGEILATKANLKALNFTGLDQAFGATDGRIEFNNAFGFDYNRTDGTSGTDFETVAAHEIGHILGFQSAVDAIDQAVASHLSGSTGLYPMDLFRFDAAGAPSSPAEFTTATRELTPGVAAVFGDTASNLALSTGALNGDGRQASHFKDDALLGYNLGIMDPTLANDVSFDVTPADLRVLDLIGYDVLDLTTGSAVTPVPLPPAGLLLGSALAVLVRLRRRSPARPQALSATRAGAVADAEGASSNPA